MAPDERGGAVTSHGQRSPRDHRMVSLKYNRAGPQPSIRVRIQDVRWSCCLALATNHNRLDSSLLGRMYAQINNHGPAAVENKSSCHCQNQRKYKYWIAHAGHVGNGNGQCRASNQLVVPRPSTGQPSCHWTNHNKNQSIEQTLAHLANDRRLMQWAYVGWLDCSINKHIRPIAMSDTARETRCQPTNGNGRSRHEWLAQWAVITGQVEHINATWHVDKWSTRVEATTVDNKLSPVMMMQSWSVEAHAVNWTGWLAGANSKWQVRAQLVHNSGPLMDTLRNRIRWLPVFQGLGIIQLCWQPRVRLPLATRSVRPVAMSGWPRLRCYRARGCNQSMSQIGPSKGASQAIHQCRPNSIESSSKIKNIYLA